jgi:hypothetical protein
VATHHAHWEDYLVLVVHFYGCRYFTDDGMAMLFHATDWEVRTTPARTGVRNRPQTAVGATHLRWR